MSNEQPVEVNKLLPPPRVMRYTGDEILKAILDRTLALIGLVLLSPILLLLALIVKLDSPGPAMYRRRVMGRGGAQFDAFKFRTMVINSDEILNAHPELKEVWLREQKLKDDPRITRSGQWMRKLSLDELPQLFNVLAGQMSLVGPRMFAPLELERYGDHALEILSVKPGITGLWQVSGRSDLVGEDRVRLDLQYVRTRSIWLDLKLLFLTLPSVFRKRGAY
jgi:lipopolysaccharide/colanic/teichoic acid biosynthesis glycosyltransferase